jgi:hypothetical protein
MFVVAVCGIGAEAIFTTVRSTLPISCSKENQETPPLLAKKIALVESKICQRRGPKMLVTI